MLVGACDGKTAKQMKDKDGNVFLMLNVFAHKTQTPSCQLVGRWWEIPLLPSPPKIANVPIRNVPHFWTLMRKNFLLFSCLLLLGGCFSSGLENVPQFYSLPAEWENDRDNFPPDFPMDSITETGRDMDIAIIGEGFFQLNDPVANETVYTRHGHFSIDAGGNFVFYVTLPSEDPTVNNLLGYPLVPDIFIWSGTERIRVHDNGLVWISQGRKVPWKPIGQIELATFAHPEGLQQVEENIYRETEASGRATINFPGTNGAGVLKPQYLEVPNVGHQGASVQLQRMEESTE